MTKPFLTLRVEFASCVAIACAIAGNAPQGAATAPASNPVQATSAPTGGAHGAQAMDAQLSQINSWLPNPSGGVPAGVDPAFWKALVPADNQANADRIALGRKLFFDTRLSKDGTVACATCHDVSRGFNDHRAKAEGIREQAKLPLINPIEMGQPDGPAVVKAIAGDAQYQAAFKAAYGRPVNYDDVGRALAAFERTLVFLDAPFDRFARGDRNAISRDAIEGWALFNGKARCTACHQISSNSPIGTDNRFHNVGVSARHQDFEGLAKQALTALAKDSSKEALDQLALQTSLSELGRFVVSRNRSDIGAFKTSQLRNVGVTGPYMHDGSMNTLWDVMDHYNKGGEANPYLDGGIEPLALNETEISQLVAFMFTLTDDRLKAQNEAELARQRQVATTQRPFRDENAANRKVLQFEARLSGKR
jgi:cytochrome c peroxidase